LKLTIFGASGKTGQLLLDQALNEGFQVTILVRNPDKITQKHSNLTIIKGDILDLSAVDRAIEGGQAVISVLGPSRKQTPFTVSRGVRNIIKSMQKYHVKRLVFSAGAGVNGPHDEPGLPDKAMKFLLMLIARSVYEDMAQAVNNVRSTNLDWTVVRAPRLVNSPKTGQVRAGYLGSGVGTRITRGSLADFMLKQVNSTEFLHDSPVISN